MGFTNGYTAANFDRNASDAEVCAAGMQVLRHMFGNHIPDPESFTFARWLSDPWALGSYSYPAVGSSLDDRRLYAEPVTGAHGAKLYFAGEATDLTDYGTVHAALRSGEAAALRIYQTYCGTPRSQGYAPWR
jgi:polyamine oxidase